MESNFKDIRPLNQLNLSDLESDTSISGRLQPMTSNGTAERAEIHNETKEYSVLSPNARVATLPTPTSQLTTNATAQNNSQSNSQNSPSKIKIKISLKDMKVSYQETQDDTNKSVANSIGSSATEDTFTGSPPSDKGNDVADDADDLDFSDLDAKELDAIVELAHNKRLERISLSGAGSSLAPEDQRALETDPNHQRSNLVPGICSSLSSDDSGSFDNSIDVGELDAIVEQAHSQRNKRLFITNSQIGNDIPYQERVVSNEQDRSVDQETPGGGYTIGINELDSTIGQAHSPRNKRLSLGSSQIIEKPNEQVNPKTTTLRNYGLVSSPTPEEDISVYHSCEGSPINENKSVLVTLKLPKSTRIVGNTENLESNIFSEDADNNDKITQEDKTPRNETRDHQEPINQHELWLRSMTKARILELNRILSNPFLPTTLAHNIIVINDDLLRKVDGMNSNSLSGVLSQLETQVESFSKLLQTLSSVNNGPQTPPYLQNKPPEQLPAPPEPFCNQSSLFQGQSYLLPPFQLPPLPQNVHNLQKQQPANQFPYQQQRIPQQIHTPLGSQQGIPQPLLQQPISHSSNANFPAIGFRPPQNQQPYQPYQPPNPHPQQFRQMSQGVPPILQQHSCYNQQTEPSQGYHRTPATNQLVSYSPTANQVNLATLPSFATLVGSTNSQPQRLGKSPVIGPPAINATHLKKKPEHKVSKTLKIAKKATDKKLLEKKKALQKKLDKAKRKVFESAIEALQYDLPTEHMVPVFANPAYTNNPSTNGNNADDDDDLIEGSMVISLVDPLSGKRLKTPLRSRFCSHVDCFDMDSFIEMNSLLPFRVGIKRQSPPGCDNVLAILSDTKRFPLNPAVHNKRTIDYNYKAKLKYNREKRKKNNELEFFCCPICKLEFSIKNPGDLYIVGELKDVLLQLSEDSIIEKMEISNDGNWKFQEEKKVIEETRVEVVELLDESEEEEGEIDIDRANNDVDNDDANGDTATATLPASSAPPHSSSPHIDLSNVEEDLFGTDALLEASARIDKEIADVVDQVFDSEIGVGTGNSGDIVVNDIIPPTGPTMSQRQADVRNMLVQKLGLGDNRPYNLAQGNMNIRMGLPMGVGLGIIRPNNQPPPQVPEEPVFFTGNGDEEDPFVID